MSGTPPTAVATTGVPYTKASSTALGIPSLNDGKASASSAVGVAGGNWEFDEQAAREAAESVK